MLGMIIRLKPIFQTMAKLPAEHKFIDLSDYGRPVAKQIAQVFRHTSVTAIHVTLMFVFAGLIAIASIYNGYYWTALLFLVIKSTLDAADGELARLKNQPSYVGRYLDSISDILLNALIFLVLYLTTDTSWFWAFTAFFCMQLQGTLYNYYYVILRNQVNGDKTSQIFETSTPTALPGEKQQTVNLLFKIYRMLYGVFDIIIYRLDPSAPLGKTLPKQLMTPLSTFGLGFQLLLIGVFLVLGLVQYIVPFFIGYTIFIFIFIGIRRWVNR